MPQTSSGPPSVLLPHRPSHRTRAKSVRALFLLSLLLVSQATYGYLVGPAHSLNEIEAEATVIFKGEALASEPVNDEWFKPHAGYAVRETRFRVISVIKGEAGAGEVRFRHYDESPAGEVHMYTPQFYHFEPGKTYIVCAQRTPEGARQTRRAHTSKMDLGVLSCRDDRQTSAKSLHDIYWDELMLLRDSPLPADVVYAIEQLQQMSEGVDRSCTKDFPRRDVLQLVRELISRTEPEVAQAAIRLVGDGSPYLSDDTAPFWLGTVGMPTPGLGQMDRKQQNPGGVLCREELVDVANSKASTETRALAIRALGLVKHPSLQRPIHDWLQSPEPEVRAAATLLSADFAAADRTEWFPKLAKDPSPEVRKCAAYAIGFQQAAGNVPLLSVLLHDEVDLVRRAARESLLSFDPKIPAVAAALRASMDHPESNPLALLTLAASDPAAHADAIAQVIREKPTPENWTGGEIPAFTAWKILFRYIRSRPVGEVKSGKWDAHLNALEQVGNYSSSEPRDLYALYLRRGLPQRAARYRTKVKKERTYDMDYYFDMVDKNPGQYEGP